MRNILIYSTLLLVTFNTKLSTASDMVLVPAGSFIMGCSKGDKQCDSDEKPAVKVNVPAFKIDTKEVTVAEYRSCVVSGKCQPPKTHSRNKYCNYAAEKRDLHPVNCIDLSDAQNYCALQGKRLLREAEWEKAARAGTHSTYAFGNQVSCKNVIANDGKTTGSVQGEMDGCGEDSTWPAASRAPNTLGIYDMHGNVGEWVSNSYAPDALAHYANGELDYPAARQSNVTRGGSWDEKLENVRASYRGSKPSVSGDVVYGSIGFRCAQNVHIESPVK